MAQQQQQRGRGGVGEEGPGLSPVQAFYRGANVLVTGATGFVGLALVEKLVRVCPEGGQIFLLVRPKRGKEAAERVRELAAGPLFAPLLAERGPDALSRLRAVAGDVGQPGLGLAAADRALLLDAVHVVVHSAATLDFEATLKANAETNLLGTRRVLELCREMRHLKAMVHVSSAYVNSNRREVSERVYPVEQDPERLLELAASLSERELEAKAESLLAGLPNSYALTKALAEHEVDRAARAFPCAIVRPSMITSVWRDPLPGWTNSKNGPTGFLMGAGKGVVRRLPLRMDIVYDYIPVDIVVNCILAAGWSAAEEKAGKALVFHCTSSTANPFTWASVEANINAFLHHNALRSAVWWPYLKFLPSLERFRIAAFFVHMLPAYLLDGLALVTGGRPILVRLHTNVNRSLARLEPFVFGEWRFDSEQMQRLHRRMAPADRALFGVDISALRWDSYFLTLADGVRRYLHREDPATLPAARRKDAVLFGVHVATQALLFALVWWLATWLLGSGWGSACWVPVLTYLMFCLI